MSSPFLSEIRIVTWNFAAKGWALTNGQTLPINQNTALFSLVGTFYGGNGTTNFMLPNLQGRIPMHAGQGNGLSARVQGAFGGIEHITPQTTPIPQSPVSPTTAYIGSQGQYATISPFIVLNFLIALQGIFPSRN
jgi:microcystin-dependent protein